MVMTGTPNGFYLYTPAILIFVSVTAWYGCTTRHDFIRRHVTSRHKIKRGGGINTRVYLNNVTGVQVAWSKCVVLPGLTTTDNKPGAPEVGGVKSDPL